MTRQIIITNARQKPYLLKASTAYREQLGVKMQLAAKIGDSVR